MTVTQGTTLIILRNLYIIMYAVFVYMYSVLDLVCCTAVCGSVNRLLCNTASAAVEKVHNTEYCV